MLAVSSAFLHRVCLGLLPDHAVADDGFAVRVLAQGGGRKVVVASLVFVEKCRKVAVAGCALPTIEAALAPSQCQKDG